MHMDFSTPNLIGGILFGSVGFVAFVYGKKTGAYKTMFLGVTLCVFPYLVSNTMAIYAVGAVLTAALYFFRD